MKNFRKGKNKLSWTAIFTKEGRAEMRRRKALKEEEEWNECLESAENTLQSTGISYLLC